MQAACPGVAGPAVRQQRGGPAGLSPYACYATRPASPIADRFRVVAEAALPSIGLWRCGVSIAMLSPGRRRPAPAHWRWRQDAMDRVSRRAPAHRRRRRARWIACSVALRPIGGGGRDSSRPPTGTLSFVRDSSRPPALDGWLRPVCPGAMDRVFHRAPAHWRRWAR